MSKFWMMLFAFTLLSPSLRAVEEQNSPPNIVFILADDLSWSDLGCYGHPYHNTPNLDRLAQHGMRFARAYSPAPICSASRAAILTGKTSARLNFEFVTKNAPGQQKLDVPMQSPPFTMNLPLAEVTMGETLSQAGYVTGFFGKWHVNQHYQGYLGWSPTHSPFQQGFAQGDPDFGSHPYTYRAHKELKNTPVEQGQFPQDSLIQKASEFIHTNQDRRFFLYLSNYYVHDPVHSRCEWLIEKYRKLLPEDRPEIAASYGAMVETLDHYVGEILSVIDQLQLAERTLIVFTSDNGGHPNYTSNAPLRGSKWNLYEGGIRVPMIARWPGRITSNATCDVPVYGCDLHATFQQIARLQTKEIKTDGVSLLPLLTEKQTSVQRDFPLVWHFPYYHPEKGFTQSPKEIGVADFETSQTRPHSAISLMHDGEQWKLLKFYEQNRFELYNLTHDISESHDLTKVHPNIARKLRSQLEDTLSEMNARFPSER